jgi:Yip1 domain
VKAAVLRAKSILIDPAGEWARIEQETGDPAFLLSRYVALLALIPALCGFIGVSVIGATAPEIGLVRAPIFDGLFGAIFGYAVAFATVLLLGFMINLLAPTFGGRRSFTSSFKLAVYSYTPVWLAGIFLLLPGLRFLALTGFYGAYILGTGLPLLMKSPEQKSVSYTASVVLSACLLTLIFAAIERAAFGAPSV